MKYKLFGIGAAVLLLTITISPVISAEEPLAEEISNAITDACAQYTGEINAVNQYINDYMVQNGGIDEYFEFTPEQQITFNIILEEIAQVYEEYEQDIGENNLDIDGLDQFWYFQADTFTVFRNLCVTFDGPFVPAGYLYFIFGPYWNLALFAAMAVRMQGKYHGSSPLIDIAIYNLWDEISPLWIHTYWYVLFPPILKYGEWGYQ